MAKDMAWDLNNLSVEILIREAFRMGRHMGKESIGGRENKWFMRANGAVETKKGKGAG